MSDQTHQAIAYVRQALADFAQTLPPSVRGPFEREAVAALEILSKPPAPAVPAPAVPAPAVPAPAVPAPAITPDHSPCA